MIRINAKNQVSPVWKRASCDLYCGKSGARYYQCKVRMLGGEVCYFRVGYGKIKEWAEMFVGRIWGDSVKVNINTGEIRLEVISFLLEPACV